MMRFMSKASMLAILTCLEDADEDADDSVMETGIWCKQNWMCIFLKCRVFDVCVMNWFYYCLAARNFYCRQHAH